MRRYRIHVLASKGRFFRAGEPIPDDLAVAGCAEKCRIREDEQPDESEPRGGSAASEREQPRGDRRDLI
jgi:hypothetical protein